MTELGLRCAPAFFSSTHIKSGYIGGIEITGNQGIGRPQRSSQILRLIKRRSKRASLSGQAGFIGGSEVLREDVVSEPGGRRRIGGIRLIVIVVIAVPGIVVIAPAVICGCRPGVVGPAVINGLVIVRRRVTVVGRATVIVGAVGIHVTSSTYVIRALNVSPASAIKVGAFHIAAMTTHAHHTAAVVNGLDSPLPVRAVFNLHIVRLDGADMTTFVARLHAGSGAGLDFPGCGRQTAVGCRRCAGGVGSVGCVRSGVVGTVCFVHLTVCIRSASGVGSACVVRAMGCVRSSGGVSSVRVVHSTCVIRSPGTVRSSWSAMGGVWAVSCVGGVIRPALGRILRGASIGWRGWPLCGWRSLGSAGRCRRGLRFLVGLT